ncbi:unnamed protein product [Lampetra fluviatilis]
MEEEEVGEGGGGGAVFNEVAPSFITHAALGDRLGLSRGPPDHKSTSPRRRAAMVGEVSDVAESQKKIEREREGRGLGGWHGVSITAAARRLTLPLTDAMRLHWQRADSAEDGPTGRWPGGGMGEPLASLGIPLASGATPRSWHPLLTQKDGARPSHTQNPSNETTRSRVSRQNASVSWNGNNAAPHRL